MADTEVKKIDDSTQTLSDDDIVENPMATRRTALGVIGTLVLGSVVGAVTAAPRQAAAATDNDPNDAAGRGRTGRTDNDPNDGAGHGRSHRGNGHSDNDPNDAGGHGRSGRSDSDPNDSAGHGH